MIINMLNLNKHIDKYIKAIDGIERYVFCRRARTIQLNTHELNDAISVRG